MPSFKKRPFSEVFLYANPQGEYLQTESSIKQYGNQTGLLSAIFCMEMAQSI